MTLNPRISIGIAVVAIILGIIGSYFAVERSKSLVTEKSAHELTKSELVSAKASLTIKDSQLKRALATRTKETPVLIGNTIAYEKTTESLENTESRIFEYAQQVETLTQANARLQDQVDRLSKVETSKGGQKNWMLLGMYTGSEVLTGLGYKYNFSLLEIGAFAYTSTTNGFQYQGAGVLLGF